MLIILTYLSAAKKYQKQYPQALIKTMIAMPISGVENIELLAPDKLLVLGHKRVEEPENTKYFSYKRVTDEMFRLMYRAEIESKMPAIKEWYQALDQQTLEEDVLILCCLCGKDKFCHRKFVFELFKWLNRKINLEYRIEIDPEIKGE